MRLNRKKKNSVNHVIHTAVMLPAAVLGMSFMVPAPAAHATIANPDEVVVTARRTEEVIQNVPISMTVFNQEMLNERNVVSGADLVNYTPSLNVNNRFGSDQASFAIRGFTQELRTTASVAVYFADVVAPRGGGSITAGDGAGPGSFFDLQNVQVLKGPQGTLFGRNTTGGAIQLVPQEPTTKLEGYLEESVGNYNMRRTQGVINVPLSDIARARFGMDAQKRDGYVTNVSGIGPNHFDDINYLAGRASLMLDLADSLQNYTIFAYTNSQNHGTLQGMFQCNPKAAISLVCQPTMDLLKGDFYAVASDTLDPVSKLKQWQLINTTTWNVNDDFTVKNILSYADLDQTMRTSVFGSDFIVGSTHLSFYPSSQYPGLSSNSQKTVVEELQSSGTALDKRLSWQGGLYFENSRPDGLSGSLSPIFMHCPYGIDSKDSSTWQCSDPFARGAVQASTGKIEYLNTAIYSQATYDITDEFRVTAGLRYTVDKTDATGYRKAYSGFPAASLGAPTTVDCVVTTASLPDCRQHLTQKSEAPTWLIDFDYLPTPDVMVYTKYARGYRQGAINIFGAEGVQTFEPEQVDAYEIGTKTSFHGLIPGTFNIAGFYNELSNQQIQVGYQSSTGAAAPTTGIVNAGSSTIQGIEVETTLKLFQDLTLSLSYTYLDTKLNSLVIPPIPANSPFDTQIPSAVQGGPLALSPHNTGTVALNYHLPLPADAGNVSMGASYTYVGEQIATAGTYGTLDPRKLVNMNLNWKGIAGSGFDASLFVTNLTQQKYATYVAGLYDASGVDFRVVGEPRMVGARVKYSFGQ